MSKTTARMAAGAVVAGGILVALALSTQAAMSTGGAFQLALIAAGVALVGLVVGAAVLRGLAGPWFMSIALV